MTSGQVAFGGPIRATLVSLRTVGMGCRGALAEERSGVCNRSVVDGRTDFLQEVLKNKRRLQVTNVLVQLLPEEPPDRSDSSHA
ncbi:MAG TPA: hypothetical protein VLB12_17970 [Gemmatimonadales bacterium]|nr:hypothetical protein [Gemmatimonadales bacterium]